MPVVLIFVVSLVPIDKLVNALTAPTIPLKVTVPLLFAIFKTCVPFSMLPKVIPPAPVEVNVVPAPKVTALL